MDRFIQWTWDRFGPRFLLACWVLAFVISLPIYSVLISLPIVAFEKSGHYIGVAAVTIGAVVILACLFILPGRRWMRPAERWAAGHHVDRAAAIEGTYVYARKATARAVWGAAAWAAALAVLVGVMVGARWTRLVQYGIVASVVVAAIQLVAYHNIVEGAFRPARIASPVTRDSAIRCHAPALPSPGDRTCRWSPPRSRMPLAEHCLPECPMSGPHPSWRS